MEKRETKSIFGIVACLVVLVLAFLGLQTSFSNSPAVYATGEQATLNVSAWQNYVYGLYGLNEDPQSIITARNVADITGATSVGTNVYAKYDSTEKQVVLFSNIDSLIYFPQNCNYCFGEFDVKEIDLDCVDTSNVTDMSAMFRYCTKLTSVNLSSFDTSNVTDMRAMFAECSALSSVDLSNFETSNVTDMSEMFYECTSLTSVNLSGFDTGNVTDMYEMFYKCSSLTGVNLSSFDTSNVTNMGDMFAHCSSLTSLDLSNFNTSKVTYIDGLISFCSSLTNLDLSSFDLSKAEDPENTMTEWFFRNCTSLAEIYLPNIYASVSISLGSNFIGISASDGTTIVKANALDSFEPSDNNVKRKIVKATAQNEATLLAENPTYFESSYPAQSSALPGTGVAVDIMGPICAIVTTFAVIMFVSKKRKAQF